VLDQSVLTLVKEDFENFFERRAWFRKHGFAFRRGYLLHGEPGTGKTSVVKAMLSSRGLTAYTLRFGDPHKDDSDLDRLFQDAVRDGPAAVLLEDIDRVFPASGEVKSNISLQQVLNSLDGIGTGDGIVVIGTANDPTRLDPAILRRPGRFDRVVQFAKPNAELRGRYIHKFGLAIDEQALVQPVAESDGFSFAFLREAIILAAQRSLVEGGDVSANDLLYAIRTLKQTMAQGSTHSKSVGLVLGKRPE
jgi:SpoVK/Ycf46/Vps4 family AAA+-type ATPase